MAEKRIKIIPDRIFHKLWDSVDDYDNVHDYIFAFTNSLSKSKINFSKYKIEYDLACLVLKSIFDFNNKSLSSIINENNIRPLDLSHRFCIPIRTIENWMSENRKPPSYIKLFISEIYNIHFLPPFVYTESLNKLRDRYSEVDSLENHKKDKIITFENLSPEQNELEIDDFDFDSIDKRMHDFEERFLNKKSNISSDILSKTDYLDNILKKK